ncbi:cation diffusion facilitator family transporter [Acetobacter sp.]|uniref:cation diffusion facilitator family transporter n=1 Tax=Acetobacter sp. TaxID=440 RepID=UPI0039E7A7E4
MVLNSAYLIVEAIWGVMANSLALMADAGHNLSDVLALGAAWLAHVLAKRSPSQRYTYGLRRSSILAALSNAVILLLVTGGIIWEAILRLIYPAETISGQIVLGIAGLGILVNGGTALLLMKGQKNDLNIRGAFLHMATDALASFAVVVAGLLIMLTGLQWLDPAISLALSALIVLATWSLLRDSLDMALDAVPKGMDMEAISAYLLALPDVTDLHDLHVWAMSTTENALTVHLIRSQNMDSDHLIEEIRETLRTRFNIVHPTIQIETSPCAINCAAEGHSCV